MNWNAFTKNLLNSLEVETEIEYSYKDESLKGFTCLSLFRTNTLTVRVYHILDEIQPLNKHFLTVFDPTKRVSDTQLVMLKGNIDVLEFKYSPKTIQPTETKVSNSAFSTHNLFTRKMEVDKVPGFYYESVGHLTELNTTTIADNGTFFLSSDCIYGIKINEESTFLELEYTKNSNLNIYTQSDKVHDTSKTRVSVNRSEFVNLINKIDYIMTL